MLDKLLEEMLKEIRDTLSKNHKKDYDEDAQKCFEAFDKLSFEEQKKVVSSADNYKEFIDSILKRKTTDERDDENKEEKLHYFDIDKLPDDPEKLKKCLRTYEEFIKTQEKVIDSQHKIIKSLEKSNNLADEIIHDQEGLIKNQDGVIEGQRKYIKNISKELEIIKEAIGEGEDD